jgi:hypothetical protein
LSSSPSNSASRALERDLDVDDSRGASEHVARALAWQLRQDDGKKPGLCTAIAEDDVTPATGLSCPRRPR